MKTSIRIFLCIALCPILLTAAPNFWRSPSYSPTAGYQLVNRPDGAPPSVREIYFLFTNKITPNSAWGANRRVDGSVESPVHRHQVDGLLDTVSVPTAITEEIWDTDLNTWVNSFRSTFTYDTNANMTEVIHQTWMFQWRNIQKSALSYDVHRRVILELSCDWTGGNWQKSHQIQYVYGLNGLVSTVTLQLWNGSTWDNHTRDTYFYDGTNNITGLLEESWSGSSWLNSLDYSATYDGSGHLQNLLHRRWETGAWLNVTSTDYSYDGSGRVILETTQYWNVALWQNDVQYLSTYDPEGYLYEFTRQNWVSSNWLNVSRETYLYDMNGNPTDEYGDEWDGFDWVEDYMTLNTYDPRDNIVESFSQTKTVSGWVNRDKVTYSRETIVTPATVTRDYSVLSRWNMVSVPLTVSSNDKNVLYPTSVSSAFFFDAGYTASPTLAYGVGYWLKFDTAQTVSMTGVVRMEDTVDVVAGWNMVGSIGVPIPAAGVGSIPGGLVSSNFFGFDAAYQASSTIEPGKGYWVKMAEAGKLVFSSSGNVPASARVRMELTDDRPPAPPEEVGATEILPPDYALEQNYPNPFNPVTEIRYALREAGHVRLSVFNVIGQEVALLVDGVREAGHQSVVFDANTLPSGVYFYRISAGTFSGVRRMVLLR